MADQPPVDLIIGMGGESGANHIALLLANVLHPALGEYRRNLRIQDGQFIHPEQVRHVDVALFVK